MTMTAEKLEQIFSSDTPFVDRNEESKCEHIVESLTAGELEIAARCSYAYMVAAKSINPDIRPSEDIRKKMAMRMARRHLIQHRGKPDKALKAVKEVIEFRKVSALAAFIHIFVFPF